MDRDASDPQTAAVTFELGGDHEPVPPRRPLLIRIAAKPVVRGTAAVSVFALAMAILYRALTTLRPPLLLQKDLLQDYLMGHAISRGMAPYQRVDVLSQLLKVTEPGAGATFPHPSPHPPAVLHIARLLAETTFQNACALWMAMSLLMLILGVHLLCKEMSLARSTWEPCLWILGVAIMSWPVAYDLNFGQFGCVLFVCFVLLLRFERRERWVLGGIALGVAFSLKLYGWPMLIRGLLMRNRMFVRAALVTFCVLQLSALAWISSSDLRQYIVQVIPKTSAHYRGSERNVSMWSFGDRLFGGLRPGVTSNVVTAPPLLLAPELVAPASAIAPALLLAFLCFATRRNPESTYSFAAFVAASTILNPVAWETYLVPLIPVVVLLGRGLSIERWPRARSLAFGSSVFVLLFMPAIRNLAIGSHVEVSAVAALVTALPIAAVLALISLALVHVRRE